MFIAFLVFEFCIGVFWPYVNPLGDIVFIYVFFPRAMATMRSTYVPEEGK